MEAIEKLKALINKVTYDGAAEAIKSGKLGKQDGICLAQAQLTQDISVKFIAVFKNVMAYIC